MDNSVSVNLHLEEMDQVFKVNESLHGWVVINITPQLAIFCTPEQAFEISKSISRDLKKLLKKREANHGSTNG